MKKIKILFDKYRELIVYFIFGVLTTVVNLITFHLLNVILGAEQYLVSNIIAWIVSVVFAYVTNKIFVFESKSLNAKVLLREFSSFLSARIFSFAVEEVGLYFLVEAVGLKSYNMSAFGVNITGELISKIILAVIVVILNYVFSKFFIFKNKKSHSEPQ